MRILLAIFLAGAASVPAMAQEPVHVVDEAGLRTAIASVPSGTTIVFDANITLTGGDLPSIANSITVDGGGHTLSLAGRKRSTMSVAEKASLISKIGQDKYMEIPW